MALNFKPRGLSLARKYKVLDLYSQGFTPSEISKKMNLNYGSVRDFLKSKKAHQIMTRKSNIVYLKELTKDFSYVEIKGWK